MTRAHWLPAGVLAGVLVVLLVLPALAPGYVLHVANFVFIATLPVIGLGFLSGFTGRVSLAAA